ncbi:protein of unknown function (plasmid) [Agrobacterium pusense]|uniref:Uncharacterized protein n=1 Tax=Agrobacterium pusense TaxID=648995 RepID=U4Q3D8_9HYPH|nr:protein of unknown function [Agrobacterium pusense]
MSGCEPASRETGRRVSIRASCNPRKPQRDAGRDDVYTLEHEGLDVIEVIDKGLFPVDDRHVMS